MKTISDSKTVHDKVCFRAGDRKLVLRIDRDGREIIIALQNARKVLQEITEDSGEEEMRRGAMAYAEAIFGREQAEQLMELYGNPVSVVNVCGQYFMRYLNKKITKSQLA